MPLKIRPEQMKAFEEESIRQFRERTVKRLKVFAPRYFELSGEAAVRDAVDLGMRQSNTYGLTTESSVHLYIQSMFILGSRFDTDPMFPWAGEILQDETMSDPDQMANRLYEKLSDYTVKALGKSNEYYFDALRRLRGESIPVSATLEDHAPEAVQRISYEKYAYVGETAVRDLLAKARQEAAAHGMDCHRGPFVITALMFFLGCGIFNDPLHPWVNEALKMEERSSADQRVDRLAASAKRVLERCLA